MLQVRWSLNPNTQPKKKRAGGAKDGPEDAPPQQRPVQQQQQFLATKNGWAPAETCAGSSESGGDDLAAAKMRRVLQPAPDGTPVCEVFEPGKKKPAAASQVMVEAQEQSSIADELALALGAATEPCESSSSDTDPDSELGVAIANGGPFDPLSLLSGDIDALGSVTAPTLSASFSHSSTATQKSTYEGAGRGEYSVDVLSMLQCTQDDAPEESSVDLSVPVDFCVSGDGSSVASSSRLAPASPSPSAASTSSSHSQVSSPTGRDFHAAHEVAPTPQPAAIGAAPAGPSRVLAKTRTGSLDLDLFAELDSLGEADLDLTSPGVPLPSGSRNRLDAPPTPKAGLRSTMSAVEAFGACIPFDDAALDAALDQCLPDTSLSSGSELRTALEALTAESAVLAKLDVTLDGSDHSEGTEEDSFFNAMGLQHGNELFNFHSLGGAGGEGAMWSPAAEHMKNACKPLASERWLAQQRPDHAAVAEGKKRKRPPPKPKEGDKADNNQGEDAAKKAKRPPKDPKASGNSTGGQLSWQLSWRMTSWDQQATTAPAPPPGSSAAGAGGLVASQQFATPYDPCGKKVPMASQAQMAGGAVQMRKPEGVSAPSPTPTAAAAGARPQPVTPSASGAKPAEQQQTPGGNKAGAASNKPAPAPRQFSWQTLKIFPQKKDEHKAPAKGQQQQQQQQQQQPPQPQPQPPKQPVPQPVMQRMPPPPAAPAPLMQPVLLPQPPIGKVATK